MKDIGIKIKRQINQNLNKLNLQKLRRFKGLLKRSTVALSIVITVLFLKKINLTSTNYLVGLVEKNIKAQVDLEESYKYLISKTERLILNSDKVLNVFNPFKGEKYSPPIEGSIYKAYKRGQNQGVDIQSISGEDPKSLTDGEVTNVQLVDKKGYFTTVKKENLEITYGYLSKAYLSKGDMVSKGEAIGSLGTNKDGKKYLRIEMKIDGEIVNPSDYINLR